MRTNPKKTSRVYNFGAGPATLPLEILQEAQAEFLDWQHLGVSVLEVGHRTLAFMTMMDEARDLLRDILAIPSDYEVLFLGGAARAQFAMVPMNLIASQQQGAYLVSGIWSKMALEEASRLKSAYCLASSESEGFIDVPNAPLESVRDHTAYLYYTSNETINGVRFKSPPTLSKSIPLVVDMTSSLLSEPLTVKDYGLIFAGAQKNIAPAGLTLVIVRSDLMERAEGNLLPSMMDYRIHAKHASLYATPPTFNCYMAHKMFHWVKAQGGISALYQHNIEKSKRLYQYIDASSFYQCNIKPDARSLMNVCFTLRKSDLEQVFIEQALTAGLYALKGHAKVGGMRASIYNAMPMEGVDALLNFMDDFALEHA